MHSGSALVETWIPVGGFRIERRKLATPDGRTAVAECLVAKWEDDELLPDRPCARQPCLHRLVAECPPERDGILNLAGRYGLLAASAPRVPRGDALVPEPLDLWMREIRALRSCAGLWDALNAGDETALRRLVPSANGDLFGDARELLARRIAEQLARVPFQLHAAPADANGFALRYRPPSLRAALWQRFAAELAGLLRCARCPAPGCGRWFLKASSARADKVFCSNACKNRAFRIRRS